MREPLIHTKWPWFSGHNDAPEPEYLVSWPATGAMIALVPRLGDSSLIALAPTAPHVCYYPRCPGDINRRKLAIFDEMLTALKLAADHFGLCGEAEDFEREQLTAIIAKAEAAKK